MNPKRKFQITSDDYQLLNFLWKWKFSTTAILHQAIYQQRNINRCYRRLISLEKNKIIESVTSRDRFTTLWQLTDLGFRHLNFDGLERDQNGYKSEHPEHDFWVSLIHLGGWVDGIPKNAELFTEQQLRSYNIESYPDWVPHTKQHRPDGLWNTDTGKSNRESLVALEVEFSRKAAGIYSEVGDFYSNIIDVSQVVWVVKSLTDANFILKNLSNGSSTGAREHSFILLSHFIEFKWQAPISVGNHVGKQLLQILGSVKTPGASLGTTKGYLDVRKKPIDSTNMRLMTQAELGVSKNIYLSK